uniref:LIM zinc-binding domain-containing protein n=1 Tax=Panagrolaimus superbus TaxID=310955 RepID=A0A914Y1F6_9BILA
MPLCPRCTKPVYFAERVTSLGKDWHRPCLKCDNEKCGKTLSAGSHSEHDGKPYCNRCYGALFGPGGTSFFLLLRGKNVEHFSGYGHGGTESHVFLNGSTGRVQ